MIYPSTIFKSTIILTRLFSPNGRLTLAIFPVLGLLSALALARDPQNSGAPVGYLQGARPITFAISSSSFSNCVSKVDEVSGGGRQDLNDFRRIGYGDPCPPPGKHHRYFFKLYAMDKRST